MIFHAVPPDGNFLFGKLVSENVRWELGFTLTLFGVRVSVSLAGSDSKTIDYCAGSDPEFRGALLLAVRLILEGLPESITERELVAIFPKWTRRPISKDPECWGRLVDLAVASIRNGEEARAA